MRNITFGYSELLDNGMVLCHFELWKTFWGIKIKLLKKTEQKTLSLDNWANFEFE